MRKQSLGGELRLQPLELALQRADAGFLHVLDDELVFAARLVQADAARARARAGRPWA